MGNDNRPGSRDEIRSAAQRWARAAAREVMGEAEETGVEVSGEISPATWDRIAELWGRAEGRDHDWRDYPEDVAAWAEEAYADECQRDSFETPVTLQEV